MLILALTFAIASIPGITAKDVYPRACVDCHTGGKNMPAPINATMKNSTVKADPALLAKAQASAPKGMSLKGKHPNISSMVKSVPADCLKCHGKSSKMAPAFATMIHVIHFTGGEKNAYLMTFGGECTHCHKLNTTTGEWTLPSAAEK